MKKIVLSCLWALLLSTVCFSQKSKLPRPSIAAGAEWYVVPGYGANLKLDLPIADGYAITTAVSYDAMSKEAYLKNYFNILSGIRFGDPKDMYAYGAIGYSNAPINYNYYTQIKASGLSVHVGGGYVFNSNIDVATELGLLTYGSDILIFKIKLAYRIEL